MRQLTTLSPTSILGVVGVLLGLTPALAWGASEEEHQQTFSLQVTGSCPSSELVQLELAPLLKRSQLAPHAAQANQVTRVVDLGDTLEVSVRDDTRLISDPKRDCAERARVAAVVIALRLEPALEPPHVETPPPTPDPTEDSSARKQPERAKKEFSLMVGAGLLVDKSGDAPLGPGLGPLALVQASRQRLLVHFAGGFNAFPQWSESGVDLKMYRFPVDLGLGWRFGSRRRSLDLLAAVALDTLHITAPDLSPKKSLLRLDVGMRAAVQVQGRVLGIHPFAQLRASWFPRNYVLMVDPAGEIARTPSLWLGISLGLHLNVL